MSVYQTIPDVIKDATTQLVPIFVAAMKVIFWDMMDTHAYVSINKHTQE